MAPDELDSLLAEQIAYYRARAHEYDATHAFDATSRARLLDALRAFAPRGRVLELACGTGRIALSLAEAGLHVTGVDRSEAMLTIARRKLASLPASVQERLTLVNQDMSALNLGRRSASSSCPLAPSSTC